MLEGTIRVMYPEIREKVKKELEDLSKNIASIYGAEAEIEYKDFTSPLINPHIPTEEVAKVAKKLLGDENVITNRPFSLGGDDFAEFNLRVPGTYVYVGSGNDKQPNTLVALHDGLFEIDEDSLLIASKLHVAYSLSFLENLL